MPLGMGVTLYLEGIFYGKKGAKVSALFGSIQTKSSKNVLGRRKKLSSSGTRIRNSKQSTGASMGGKISE